MNTATPTPPPTLADHMAITPTILYFGTPVVLLTTENDDGSFNLAPMSSAWALGQALVLSLGSEGQTATSSCATTWSSACPHPPSGRQWNGSRH